MPTQVDDELEKYAAKPSGDDELEKYAQKPAPKSGSLDEYLSQPFNAGSSGSSSEPSLLHKITHEYPAAALSAAGLPTSLSDVPDWARKMTGQTKGQPIKLGSVKDIGAPVIQPIKEAAKNPTEENIVNAVPIIGPGSVQSAHKFVEGKPGEGVASLAGTIAPFAAPKVAKWPQRNCQQLPKL